MSNQKVDVSNKASGKTSEQVSSGVEALITQLRTDGVKAGEKQASEIVARAQAKADSLILDAEEKAQAIITSARVESVKIERGGKDALEIAMRDILLSLKSRLSELVGQRVQRLICAELEQDAFLKELIIEMAHKAKISAGVDSCKEVEFKLPHDYIGLDELRHKPLELREGSLSHFILSIAADVLREGVSFSESDERFTGLKIELKEQDIVVDITDDRLSDILLQHLQPRFRAILEGMVK